MNNAFNARSNINTPKKRFRRLKNISVRWNLFHMLAVFIIFSLAVVWLFQVKLLGLFYENVKRSELERVADAIETHIDDETLETIAYQCAVDYSVCVRIMRIDGNTAYEQVSVDVVEDCVLHHITNDYISVLYRRAMENSGEYAEKRTRAALHSDGYYYPPFYFSPENGKVSAADMTVESNILDRKSVV